MIRFYYHQTPDEGGSLVEFTDRVNLTNENVRLTTNAEQSSIGSCEITIEDPEGDWYMTGHRRVIVLEDSAPAENQMIGWFYTAGRAVERLDAPIEEGRRKWVVQLTDINTLIGRRVMGGNDTDRPEETDVERIQWLVTTSEANAFDDVTTFVSTASPVNMSDSNYNGQALQSVIDDCQQQSGKNAYLRFPWDAGASDYVAALWYGADTVALAESTLRISNVLEDVDFEDTWPASADSRFSLDPSRVFSGVFGNYDGGWVYRQRSATATEFARRDTVATWPNIRRQARAEARADRYLNTLHNEEKIITTSILVTPEHVNDAHAGDLIDVKFSHFPDFEDWRPCRILNRTVIFLTPEVYQIDYTLTPQSDVVAEDLLVAIINTGGPTWGADAPGDASIHPWTQVFWTGVYSSPTQFPGPGGPGGMGMWIRKVVPGEDETQVIQLEGGGSRTTACWVYQIAGASRSGMDSTYGTDEVPYGFGTEVTLDSPSAAVESVFMGAWMLQKVTYGQATVLNTSQGSELGLGNVNGNNDPTAGACGLDDPSPPTAHLGYETGTGVLTLGAEFECDGAGPGDYNHYGRGYGGLLLALDGAFSVVQEGFAVATAADVVVGLPDPL